jgi:hypothetical protein
MTNLKAVEGTPSPLFFIVGFVLFSCILHALLVKLTTLSLWNGNAASHVIHAGFEGIILSLYLWTPMAARKHVCFGIYFYSPHTCGMHLAWWIIPCGVALVVFKILYIVSKACRAAQRKA